MRLQVALVASATLLGLPGVAGASIVSLDGPTALFRSGFQRADVVGRDEHLGNPRVFEFADAAGFLRAGTNCVAGSPVLCTLADGVLDADYDIRLDGGNDRAKVLSINYDVAMSGGAGRDELLAGGVNNAVNAGPGDDTVVASANGHSEIYGDDGADTLYGQELAPHLFGGGGDDLLATTGYNPALSGGTGDDTLFGGPGPVAVV